MLIQRFLPRPTSLLAVSFFKQHSASIVRIHSTPFLISPNPFSFFTSLSARPPLLSSSLCSISTSQTVLDFPDAALPETEYGDEFESEGTNFGTEEYDIVTEGLEEVLEANSEAASGRESKRALPSLSVKEKKELASYAHSLGKKLKSQQVGKSGVTDTVIMALIETLEANELLKLKVHNTCPGELDDIVKQVEEGTGSVVVGQIGRTVILYRPSLSKMKAEERKGAQRSRTKKHSVWKLSQNKTQVPRQTGRGRRGSSRYAA